MKYSPALKFNMASEIAFLTDEELRTKLRSFNLTDGPITKTTRKLFEAKLARAMGLNKQVDKPVEAEKQEVNNSSDQGTINITGLIEKGISVCNAIGTKEEKDNKQDTVNKQVCTFYGVRLDNESESENVGAKCISVFTDITETLHCVNKNKGARFRPFSTRNEAEAFASGKLPTPSRQLSQELSPGPVEPTSEYRTPKRGEITNYRKLIEKGEVDSVAKIIYGNPKFLISSGDTPFIIQEGCHYNSMHVASRAGHRDICKLIIETLNDDEFWKLIYPVKENSVNNVQLNNRRKAFLLDLYLNTPDKGGCETPLHFACKFGKADVVEYLLSCPGVETTVRNKEGKTAEQVICARMPNCEEKLPSRIQNMFHKPENVCVPILRSDDNCASPKIGTPWSPNLRENYEDVFDGASPGEPKYRVRAYAGPMSPQEAEKFCYALRSPRATPDKQAKFRNIKRSDSEKGLERVARKVAKSQNVSWCEHWKFLECFTDLSTEDGLAKLEKYLKEKTEAYRTNAGNIVPLKTPVSSKCTSVRSLRGIYSGDDVFDGSECTPKSDTNQPRDISSTPCSRTRYPSIKNFRNRLNLDESPESGQNTEGDDVMDLNSNLGDTDVKEDGKGDIQTKPDMDTGICEQQQQQANGKYCNSTSRGRQSTVSPDTKDLSPGFSKTSLDISNCSEDSLSGMIEEFRALKLDESAKSKQENGCANKVSESSPTDDRCGCEIENTQREEDVSFFIEGIQPSKVDLDVFRSIKTTTIDPVVYPYVSCWQKMVRSFSKTTRQAWPSPGSPRYYKTRRGIAKTLSC